MNLRGLLEHLRSSGVLEIMAVAALGRLKAVRNAALRQCPSGRNLPGLFVNDIFIPEGKGLCPWCDLLPVLTAQPHP